MAKQGINPAKIHRFRKSYKRRDDKLHSLGFASYKEYLKSDQWKAIRQEVMERAEWKCQICQGRATAIHHKNYSLANLSRGTSLIPICGPCHKFIEFDRDGKKVRLSEANRRIYLLLSLKRKSRFSSAIQSQGESPDRRPVVAGRCGVSTVSPSRGANKTLIAQTEKA